jgi:PAS domain S-box-containing protein
MATIPVGLLITTKSGAIETASPACLELFNCSYENLISRKLGELFLLEGATTDDLLNTGHKQREVTARRYDGSQFPAAIKVASFASSTVPGLLVAIEDVSAKHELERMKQEFVSMITHDLRTPLTSVQCFLNLITEGVFDQREQLLKTKAAGMEGETSRLIKMISSLLNLHKLEAGRLQLTQEVVMVKRIVARSLQSITALAESRNVPLEVMHIKDNILVSADSDYTVQVLVNLLSNALKFSPEGSPVTISVAATDQFIKIMVIDKGRGIPKDFQSRLFNRFEQAQMSDARVHGGSGLGLAISKAIIEEQGGSIGVESEPGKGCIFWFTLVRETIDEN